MSQVVGSFSPLHVAIIMDGNRRWARARGLPDAMGHKEGANNLERTIEAASKLGIKTVTVYALSTENLQERAKRELAAIFKLIETFFQKKLKNMSKKGVLISVLGEMHGLPKGTQRIIEEAKKVYIKNESIKLNIALNYGGRKEIITAMKKLVESGVNLDSMDEKEFQKHLYTQNQSDPDLVIRTGGKIRLSNFLLWQTAYSELYFSKKLWPDFNSDDLKAAVRWFQRQKRNFGK